jgi:pantetheine-phosphate adenylyltransferase
MTLGIYAGSFDPITSGHLDIMKRSMQFCDELIVAIGDNPNKKTTFGNVERLHMIQSVIDTEMPKSNAKFGIFSGLLVTYAAKMKANILIRGIRSVSDFEYEINLANINKTLAPNLETVFLPTSPTLGVVSSSAVKEILKHRADISSFVPPVVHKYLMEQMAPVWERADKK